MKYIYVLMYDNGEYYEVDNIYKNKAQAKNRLKQLQQNSPESYIQVYSVENDIPFCRVEIIQ